MTNNDCIMPAIISSYNPLELSPLDWQKKAKGHLFACRKVYLPVDLSFIANWNHHLLEPGSNSIGVGLGIGNHLHSLATGGDGQPYMIFCDNEPVCQVEILVELYSDIGLLCPIVEKSDYFFHFHYAPGRSLKPLQATALQIMVDWLLSQGIARLWAMPSEYDLWAAQMLVIAGFEVYKLPGDEDFEERLFYFPPK